MSPLRGRWTRGQHLLTPTRKQTPLLKYERHVRQKSVGGGLKPVADDHEQHYNRTNTATFSVLHAALRIDHRTIVRDSRCHGAKFCGVELQQQQRAVATNGGMDSDWLEGQRPEARGPVVLRAAAAAVAGGNGDGGWWPRRFLRRQRRWRTSASAAGPAYASPSASASISASSSSSHSSAAALASTAARRQQDICYCTCDLVIIMVMF